MGIQQGLVYLTLKLGEVNEFEWKIVKKFEKTEREPGRLLRKGKRMNDDAAAASMQPCIPVLETPSHPWSWSASLQRPGWNEGIRLVMENLFP